MEKRHPFIALVRLGRVRVIPRARSVVSRVRKGIYSVATFPSTRWGRQLGYISTTTPFSNDDTVFDRTENLENKRIFSQINIY